MEGSSETLKDDGDKKSPFDDLDREELIKKCKALLMLAQKCKVTKSELQNELESYKSKLIENAKESKADKDSIRTLQELVDSLTEQKLTYITEKDAAESKIRALAATCKVHEENINKYKADIIVKNDKIKEISNLLSNLDSESISLKRQNGRLLEENEQLISQLSEMEVQIQEFNKIGLQQQEQLHLLENKVVPGNTLPGYDDNELQEKNIKLETEIENFKILNEEFNKKNIEFETKLNDITIIYNLEKEKNDKVNNKLRSYRDKILKCASCINQLKNSRYILTKTVKEYSDCIPKWQNEIIKASKILDDQLNSLHTEIKTLRERLNTLENEYKNILTRNSQLTHEKKELNIQNQELRNTIQTVNENNSSNSLENLQLHVRSLESEKSILVKEKLNARDYVLDLESQLKVKTQELDNLKIQLNTLTTQLNSVIQEKNNTIRTNSKENESELIFLRNELKSSHQQIESLKKDNDNLLDFNGILKEEVDTLKLSLEQPNDSDNLSQESASLQADIVKLEAKLSTLQQDNARLLAEAKESRNKVKDYDSLKSENGDNKENILSYKKENSELLLEMKEINQVLKERGENISKQQKAITEMERLIEKIEADRDCIREERDDLEKKNIHLENELKNTKQLSSKEHNETTQILIERDNALKNLTNQDLLITSLKDEIEKLKMQQLSSGSVDLPNEDMSTSTISRAEEHLRMKDIDDTFEDRYSKLRLFAVKLKKKLNETTSELQSIKKDKANLEKLLPENRVNVEGGNKETSNLDTSNVCDDNNSINVLKQKLDKEIEITGALKNESEKLKVELTIKEQQLKDEIDAHKATKDILDKTQKNVKKKNVLSLEMEDYERSMKELTTKMEEKKNKMIQLESTIDNQQGTITTMRTQIKLLEDQIKNEEKQNRNLKEELQCSIEETKTKEKVINSKNDIMTKMEYELEDYRRKFEEMKVELTAVLGEKEKTIMGLSEDKLELNNKVKKLEFKCAELDEKLKVTGIELEDLKTEYTSYKVRAQAVLRQNQTIDHSQEEQLKEESAALKVHVNTLTAKLNTVQEQYEELKSITENEKRRSNELANEAARASQRTARLQSDLARLTAQLDAERTQNNAQVSTLTQCYKTQISELEAKLQKETEELRRKLSTASEALVASDARFTNKHTDILYHKEDSDVEMDINMTMLPREEGEGSEAAPSPPLSKQMGGGRRSPVPLERLLEEGVPDHDVMEPPSLALTPEQELADLRRQLQAQLQRVKHVTVLLAESEREGARAAQMNELLKAELRRARDSMERTHHAHNAEYIKNVVLKFVTLPPGDERCRLVPVLQKILTLNPEEKQNLTAVAKGLDPNAGRGWGSYLPWSGAK